MNKHIKSIRAVFMNATPEQIKNGVLWYDHARKLVIELAYTFKTDISTVSGVIAALSQRTQWSTNIDRAVRVLDGENSPGGLPEAAKKACQIRDGENPVDILGKHAHKIKAFYYALMGDDSAAVIDTWMLSALNWYKINKITGERYQGYSRLQYEKLAYVLKNEAERQGFTTVEYQAIVWCIIRGKSE